MLLILGPATLAARRHQRCDPGPRPWSKSVRTPSDRRTADAGQRRRHSAGQPVTLRSCRTAMAITVPTCGPGNCKSPLYTRDSTRRTRGNVGSRISSISPPSKRAAHSLPRNQRALAARLPAGLAARGPVPLRAGRRSVHALAGHAGGLPPRRHAARAPWPRRSRRHRGPLGFEEKTFEVRRLDPAGAHRPSRSPAPEERPAWPG